MKSRRTIILIVAVIVGAIAAFGLLNYVRNVEGSVYDDAAPSQVWLVREDVPKGTPIAEAMAAGMIVEGEIPGSFRPATAVVDPQSELAGLVAVADLPANSPVVQGHFASPTSVSSSVTDRLEQKGMVTMTMSVSQVRGVAYLVEPGDFVNILGVDVLDPSGGAPVTADFDSEEGETSAATSPDQLAFTSSDIDGSTIYDNVARYIYQRAEVLAVDKGLAPDLGETADPAQATEARNSGLITLAVPPEVVQVLLSVGENAFYLSLVPPSYEPKPLPPVDYDEVIYPGEDANRLTPYGPGDSTDAVSQDGETK